MRGIFTPRKIEKIGVIGLGLMGHGIAQVAAQHGFRVVALEAEGKYLDAGLGRIQNSMKKIFQKKVEKQEIEEKNVQEQYDEILGRIKGTLNIEDLKKCDLIIEAVVENIDTKKHLVEKVSKIVKEESIIASNTSSLPITELAVASGIPERFVGVHFFNPVQIMKLVEVIKTDKTEEDVFETVLSFVKRLGKNPISCSDTPGFVVNRLLVPYLAQSILMLEKKVATKEDIDSGMRLGAGHPMGPITLADYVGLDTCLSILEGWKARFPDEPAFFIPESLREKVAEGKFGLKTGEGYYKWEKGKVVVEKSTQEDE